MNVSPYLTELHRQCDPSLVDAQSNAREQLRPLKLISTALTVSTVALLCLAICTTSSVAFPLLCTLGFVGLYYSYNVRVLISNLESIINDPYQTRSLGGLGGVDERKIAKILQNGTVGFSWITDALAHRMYFISRT
jgi:hypothetical protein